MKNPNSKTTGRRMGAGILTFGILIGTAITAFGQTDYYWDSNNVASGFGSTGGTWGTSNYWNTDITGGAGGSFTTTTTGLDTANFGTATLNYAYSSIGVAASGVSIGNIVFGAAQTTAITALGSSSYSITINNGITKNNPANVTITSPITLGGVQSWTNNNTTGELVVKGAVNTAGNILIFDGAGTTNFGSATTGVISGTGGVTVTAGRVYLGAASAPAHTYSGPTTLNGGVTMCGNAGNGLSTKSNIVMNGGILEVYSSSSFVRTLGTGAGQLQVIGGESGFGTYVSGAAATFNLGTKITWGSPTFNPSKLVLQSPYSQNNSYVIFASAIDLNGATRTILVNNGSTGNARAIIYRAISNSIGTAGLIKEGPGVLTLSDATNAWNGATSVQGGYLDLAGMTNANLGGGSGRNVTVASGCGIRFDAISNTFLNRLVETSDKIGVLTGTTSNDLDFSSSTGANLPNAFLGTWATNGAKAEYSGTLTPASDNYRLGGYPIKSGVLGMLNSSPMTGTQGLIVDGYVELVGPKTFTGDTVLETGSRLGLASITGEGGVANCLQNSILNVGATGGTIWLEATGSNSMTGAVATTSAVFGGLEGSRNLSTVITATSGGNNTYATAVTNITGFTLDLSDGNTATYSGAIGGFGTGASGGTGGAMTLTKSGLGTQILSGASTYTGNTTVTAGTLVANNSSGSATGSGSVTVNSGATLAGSGIIGGPTVTINGSIAPSGTLTLSNALPYLAFGAGSQVNFDLGTSSDKIAFTNIADSLGGSGNADLNLTLGPGFSYSNSYTIIQNTSTAGFTFSSITGYDSNMYSANLSKAGNDYVLSFTQIKFSVTYDGNGSTGGTAPVDGSSPYWESDTVTVLGKGTLERTGYAFNNWNTAADSSGTPYNPTDTFSMPAHNVTLYAQWTAITPQYTVDFATDGTPKTSLVGSTSQTVDQGSDCTPVTAVAAAGYYFTGWTGSLTSSDNPITVTNVQSNMNLTANFAPTQKWDFNGDGRSDVLANDTNGDGIIYLMNGATPDSSGTVYKIGDANWKLVGLQDFNGDGKTDMLWQHATTGKAIMYIMDGLTVTSYKTIYKGGTNWWINKFGDFNGDGKTDIIWKHSTGSYVIWLMNGGAAIGTTSFSQTTWTVVGTGDFNYDGKSDILWEKGNQGVIYLMNGTAIESQGIVYTKSDPNWVVTNLLDYNNDGKCDMLWNNNVTKSGIIYLMNGISIDSSGFIYSNVTSWQVIQSGDFNHDGCNDLLWQNTTGKALIWLMNGITRTAHSSPYTATGNWVVKQLLDFNDDGNADILIQNADTKQAFDYLIDGTNPPIGTGTVFAAGTKTVVVPLAGN